MGGGASLYGPTMLVYRREINPQHSLAISSHNLLKTDIIDPHSFILSVNMFNVRASMS